MTKSAFKSVALIAAIAFPLAACATGKTRSSFQIFQNPLSSAVASKTKTFKLYNQLDTILIMDAVYNDMDLRRAWVEQEAETRRLDDEARKEMIKKQEGENARHAQFIVALYTSEDEWNDLAKEDSRWALFINGENGAKRPASVEKIKLEKLNIRDNLPFETTFRSFYLVNFDREKVGAPPYELVMSGLLGEARLTWEGR